MGAQSRDENEMNCRSLGHPIWAMSSSPVHLERDCVPERGEHSVKNATWAFQGQDSEPESFKISSSCTFSFYDLLASVYGTIMLTNSGKGVFFLRWKIYFEVISGKICSCQYHCIEPLLLLYLLHI